MIESGEFDLLSLVEEAGHRCSQCGSGRCARRHAWRYRKKVTDLSTGEVFEHLPILRILFCDGATTSLTPADLWRGHFTVSSVIETVVHVTGDGLLAASEWVLYGGDGDELVSERTLRRWRDSTRSRLIGSALAWLGPRLGVTWSGRLHETDQLSTLLDPMPVTRDWKDLP